MEKKYYEGIDGTNIPYLEFPSKRGDIKKNIIIIHGMVEHIHRYEEFSEFLSSNGYNVYVLECRGHGELKVSKYGDFGKLGLTGVVDDVKKFISENFQEEKPIVIGHSMGSEIAQRIVIDEQIQYYVLSGQPDKSLSSLLFGRFVSRLEIMSFFIKKSILNKVFSKYNKKFSPNKTYSDWLSRDEKEVEKFVNDELCGYNVSPRFFNELFKLMTYTKRNAKKTKDDASALLVFGTMDQATKCGKSQKKYAKTLKNKKRKIKILKNEDGRHESLNETNRYQIYDEILQWLNDNVVVK